MPFKRKVGLQQQPEASISFVLCSLKKCTFTPSSSPRVITNEGARTSMATTCTVLSCADHVCQKVNRAQYHGTRPFQKKKSHTCWKRATKSQNLTARSQRTLTFQNTFFAWLTSNGIYTCVTVFQAKNIRSSLSPSCRIFYVWSFLFFDSFQWFSFICKK